MEHPDFDRFSRIVRETWSAETSLDPRWSEENAALGQCAVTSCLVQDYFGGRIVNTTAELPDGTKDSHYYNIIAGEEIDLTREQFPEGTTYSEPTEKRRGHNSTRAYVLSYDATKERYETLRNKVEAKVNVSVGEEFTKLVDDTFERFEEFIDYDPPVEADHLLELKTDGTNAIMIFRFDDNRPDTIFLYLESARDKEYEYIYERSGDKVLVVKLKHDHHSESKVRAYDKADFAPPTEASYGTIDALTSALREAKPHPYPQSN